MTMRVAYLLLCSAVCYSVLAVWLPFRVGRRPWAIYDQGSTIAVLGTLWSSLLKSNGTALWVGGVGGVACGIGSCLLMNNAMPFIRTIRSELVLSSFYIASFILFGICTVLGVHGARWIFGV